jgi:hypothetical protein
VIGGILGYAVGKEVAQRSLARNRSRPPGTAAFYISPEPTGETTIGFRWSF